MPREPSCSRGESPRSSSRRTPSACQGRQRIARESTTCPRVPLLDWSRRTMPPSCRGRAGGSRRTRTSSGAYPHARRGRPAPFLGSFRGGRLHWGEASAHHREIERKGALGLRWPSSAPLDHLLSGAGRAAGAPRVMPHPRHVEGRPAARGSQSREEPGRGGQLNERTGTGTEAISQRANCEFFSGSDVGLARRDVLVDLVERHGPGHWPDRRRRRHGSRRGRPRHRDRHRDARDRDLRTRRR